jgi:hypothetical protein
MLLWWQFVKPSATLAEEYEHFLGVWLAEFSVVFQKHHE